ncbi:hypothetical protein BDY19DRAFT_981736 [Irpex rosettiformis]|uniref:Uncharacterized protein n=1 Tax=Irpex rosettiformis TaxID=378272 RepID=A0ACB8TLQ3_9APHY|nr:hypothetical protein BDY19DRAFT_981736 [Irpex rosettiformis]
MNNDDEDHSETTVEWLLRAAKAHFETVKSVAKDIVVVISNNPKTTCLIVVCGVAFIVSMALAGPVLGALGFSATGTVAGGCQPTVPHNILTFIMLP